MRSARNVTFVLFIVCAIWGTQEGVLAYTVEDLALEMDQYCSLGSLDTDGWGFTAACDCAPEDEACLDYVSNHYCNSVPVACEDYCSSGALPSCSGGGTSNPASCTCY